MRQSILPSVSPYESGVLGALPPAPAYHSGVLGVVQPSSLQRAVQRSAASAYRRSPPRLTPVSAYRSGLPPAPAYRSGSLGALPPAPAYHSGVLGVFGTPPPSGAFRSGSLGVLGTPPPSGAIKSGILGSLGVPPPAGAVRSGSLGVFGEAFGGLGAGASIMPEYQPIGFGDDAAASMVPTVAVAAAGLGALAVIWWAMTRRHA